MADEQTEKHPYYGLDSGSPHMAPEDYAKAGLGDFDKDPSRAAALVQEPSPEDERLAEQVRDRLAQHEMIDPSRIEVHVIGGEVRLIGTAENRYIRHRAEELAREIEGVTEVLNKIAVQPTDDESSPVGGPTLSVHEPGANNSGSTQRS